MTRTRVGFRYIDSRIWQGGYNYLLNLCRAIRESDRPLEPVVFGGIDAPVGDRCRFEELLGRDFVPASAFTLRSLGRRRLRTLFAGRDSVAERAFRACGVDVVFENADFYGRSFGLPAIAWVPDFRHRHLPETFTRWQIWRRELGFRAQFGARRQVMVSSQDARRDAHAFYGLPETRVQVVRFAVPFDQLPPRSTSSQISEKYDLPANYFFLPNQFWQHKNHDAVVEALRLLKEAGENVVVAVSGAASHPSCIPVLARVRAKVEQLGLESSFRLLGRIPYEDLICLLSRSRALINPSLFEGWSTTIEEAKALGVDMVLSDLAVHREQVPEGGRFFDPSRPRELADEFLRLQSEVRRRKDEAELRSLSQARMSRFVGEFTNLVEKCRARRVETIQASA